MWRGLPPDSDDEPHRRQVALWPGSAAAPGLTVDEFLPNGCKALSEEMFRAYRFETCLPKKSRSVLSFR